MDHHLNDRGDVIGSAKNLGVRSWHTSLSTLGDFRKFLLRGNVVDLAVGVVIGAAFNSVVQGLVKDVITPLIGAFVNIQGFDGFKFPWHGQVFNFGDLIGILISFILTAAVVYFFVVKPINVLEDRFRPKQQPASPTTRECPFCLSTVPLKATRCAYCTTQLPPAEELQSQEATA
jgi:large conductance mechanosensitive channel